MTFEQYKQRCTELEEAHKKDLKAVMVQYCNANNPYTVGDIVTDHIGSIKVERIQYEWGRFGEPPCCVYYGLILKKDLTPTKKEEKRHLYQSNIKQPQQ